MLHGGDGVMAPSQLVPVLEDRWLVSSELLEDLLAPPEGPKPFVDPEEAQLRGPQAVADESQPVPEVGVTRVLVHQLLDERQGPFAETERLVALLQVPLERAEEAAGPGEQILVLGDGRVVSDERFK